MHQHEADQYVRLFKDAGFQDVHAGWVSHMVYNDMGEPPYDRGGLELTGKGYVDTAKPTTFRIRSPREASKFLAKYGPQQKAEASG